MLQEIAQTPAATPAAPPPPDLFRSFWMGGYECATHINVFDQRLDMLAAINHDTEAEQDYALLKTAGMRTARDGLRWHLIEKTPGNYDWSSFEPMLRAALNQNVQVIWDICHYGWPDGLDIFSPAFIDRFSRFCGAVARFVADHTGEIPFYSPINEISFFSWAAARDVMYPFAHGRDNELKHQMIRACIAGIEAIWQVDPRARLTFPEPIINVVTPRAHQEYDAEARAYNNSQYEVWDMLAGRVCPELGGDPKYLDIVGANFYHSNQWEIHGTRLRWEEHPRDARWKPLHRMLLEIWNRYRRPLYLAETSHVGVGRADWIKETASEVILARENGVPLEGVCLYPILDRFDWQDPNHWHNSGLWDLPKDGAGRYHRVLNRIYGEEFARAREALTALGCR